MTNIRDALGALVEHGELSLVESLDLPPRAERRLPIPAAFQRGAVWDYLSYVSKNKTDLWSHQSLALECFATIQNVVIATSTASGKSLVFQSAALRLISNDADARIMVFYPLKALAGDHMVAW